MIMDVVVIRLGSFSGFAERQHGGVSANLISSVWQIKINEYSYENMAGITYPPAVVLSGPVAAASAALIM